ncbi:MAG: hypothetical protein AAB836_01185 [Patescibacteria group bacterium]
MQPKFNEWGNPRFRYDHQTSSKFDISRSADFKSDEPHQKLLKNVDKKTILPIDVQIPLADGILRNRVLVGVVLGSTAKTLLSFQGDRENLKKHNDLDVLVLNPFGSNHPYPREASIDWWVKPGQTPPTNGVVNMHYDLSLRQGISIKDDSKSSLALQLKPDTLEAEFQAEKIPEIIDISRNLKRQILNELNCELEPGLYLPAPETLQSIAIHCEEKYRQLSRDLQEALNESDVFLETAHPKMLMDEYKMRHGEIGPDYFIEKWEAAIRKRYKNLHKILTEMGQSMIFGGEYSRHIRHIMKIRREKYGPHYLTVLIEYFQEECERIKRHIKDNYESRLTEGRRPSGDYSYLKIPKDTQLMPAIPVLPAEALILNKQ